MEQNDRRAAARFHPVHLEIANIGRVVVQIEMRHSDQTS